MKWPGPKNLSEHTSFQQSNHSLKWNCSRRSLWDRLLLMNYISSTKNYWFQSFFSDEPWNSMTKKFFPFSSLLLVLESGQSLLQVLIKCETIVNVPKNFPSLNFSFYQFFGWNWIRFFSLYFLWVDGEWIFSCAWASTRDTRSGSLQSLTKQR